ncbi:hypothetical protein V2W30_21680 [Streptomyces sp. Q6]|uniref:Uncharacterized protein n=1 Tax=Streptomyces citrinus TaxID=3118173 RepID=A0ACD5AEL6_9ACTN
MTSRLSGRIWRKISAWTRRSSAARSTVALTLASTAADVAGPASVLAWEVLVAVSLPVALVFAALGARRPDSGGAAAFVRVLLFCGPYLLVPALLAPASDRVRARTAACGKGVVCQRARASV